MNVLILGGGYIGTHLFNRLKHGPNDTVELITQKQVNYTMVNESSVQDFKSYLHDKRFDIAVNCSGYTGKPNVDACEDNKDACWEYNVLAPVRTIEVLNAFRIPVLHVSSGCIYEGSFKFDERDVPNFGLYDDHSSFYSKSKHAGELALKGMLGYIFRIRMPFCASTQHKNILMKYLKYDNIVSYPNSLTSIYDLCDAIGNFCIRRSVIPYGTYNIVNRGQMTGEQVINLMKEHGIENPNWRVVPIEDIDIKAGRSNCTLSCDKLYKYVNIPYVEDSLRVCLRRLKGKLDGNA